MFQKAFFKIWILLILAVVIVGGVLVYLKWPRSVQKEWVLTEEVIDWKIYRNEGHKYELKYPNDWFLSEFCEGIAGQRGYCKTKKAGFSSTATYDRLSKERRWPIGGIPNDDDINIHVTNKKAHPGKSLRDFVIYLATEIENYKIEEIVVEEKISPQGLSYFLYKDPTYPASFQEAFFENKNDFYMIQVYVDIPDVNMSLRVFNQMLSTFRFLE